MGGAGDPGEGERVALRVCGGEGVEPVCIRGYGDCHKGRSGREIDLRYIGHCYRHHPTDGVDTIGNRVGKGIRAEVIGSRGVGKAPVRSDGKRSVAWLSGLGVAEGLAFLVGGGKRAVVDRIFGHGERQKGRDRRIIAQQQMHRPGKSKAGRWGCRRGLGNRRNGMISRTQGGPAGRNQQHQHERGKKVQPSPFTGLDGLAASG